MESGKAGPLAHQLQKLLGYANIPRKKNKFVNFASSCLGLRSPADVERVWSAIEAANRKDDHLKDDKSKQSNGRQEAEVPEDEERKDHLKGVASAPVADRRQGIGSRSADVAPPKAQSCLHFDSLNQVTCDAGDGGPSDDNVRMCLAESSDSRQEQFSWKKTIKRLLKASEGKEMPLKHLQRQVRSPIDFPLLLSFLSFPPSLLFHDCLHLHVSSCSMITHSLLSSFLTSFLSLSFSLASLPLLLPPTFAPGIRSLQDVK